MRFLIDASLSPQLVKTLNRAGHDALHVGDVLSLDAPDDTVFDTALDQQRVLVTADTDFGEILARRQATSPSVVLFRTPTGRRPSDLANLLVSHLPDIAEDLVNGAIAVFQETRLRVRSLPLSGTDVG